MDAGGGAIEFNAQSLRHVRGVIRFFDFSEREVCARHALTQTEADILAFLDNNPERDTASDIVEYRMLPKGYVSKAVEALIRGGYLLRSKDGADRRRIHLLPTDAARPVLRELSACREEFQNRLFAGFTPEERRAYESLSARIYENAASAMKGTGIASNV